MKIWIKFSSLCAVMLSIQHYIANLLEFEFNPSLRNDLSVSLLSLLHDLLSNEEAVAHWTTSNDYLIGFLFFG